MIGVAPKIAPKTTFERFGNAIDVAVGAASALQEPCDFIPIARFRNFQWCLIELIS